MAVIAVGDIDAAKIEQRFATTFGAAQGAGGRGQPPDRKVPLHQELLVSVVDRSRGDAVERRRSMRKRPRESESHVGDYRRDLIERIVDRMMDERFGELARQAGREVPRRRRRQRQPRAGRCRRFSMARRRRRTAGSRTGSAALAIEAQRVREFGFTATEMDRAKQWMAAFYERAYNERDKTESGVVRAGIRQLLPRRRADARHRLRIRARQQLLPTITADEASALARVAARATTAGSSSRSRRRSPASSIPTEAELQAALATADTRRASRRGPTTATTRELMEQAPDAGHGRSTRATIDDARRHRRHASRTASRRG